MAGAKRAGFMSMMLCSDYEDFGSIKSINRMLCSIGTSDFDAQMSGINFGRAMKI